VPAEASEVRKGNLRAPEGSASVREATKPHAAVEKIPDETRQISPSENCWAFNWNVSFVELNA
jgi:hypothetical protein